MNIRMLKFIAKGDSRGSLISLESGNHVPFVIKRVYYIFGTQSGVERGFHAHRTLQQVAICVRGSCEFRLRDGREECTVQLSSPEEGLYIGEMVWREMANFSSDCLLMVLASEGYIESDYVRDFNEFMSLKQL